MSQFNNLNVLPFYTDLKYQTRNKWYAFGAIWGLASPANSILPFQLSLPYNLTSVESFQVKNLDSSTVYSPSAKPSINNSKFSTRGYSIVKLVETVFDESYKLPVGTYYIEMKLKDSGDTTYAYYSEVFTVVNNISDFLKIQYWNEDNMYYSNGEINYEDNFKFTMYLCATIGKPEYEFEEELTKRGGYPFLESQISSKLYKFAFIAPEFICDAMRLIRMSDYIRISSNGLDYNALTFSYEPNWEEQGDLASVQAEFTVDDIIQKLASFNRRVKESFYNALLADVNEPMMFDAESIAQHYKSALGGATANLVNGLLIRELEELKAYKQDYYAVLDTGEGAAKKILLSNLLAGISGNIDTSNFVTTDATEQNVIGVKNFNAGITIGSSKIKAYEKDGCLFIDGNLALTGGLTMYAAGTQGVGSIYDGLPIDNDTIYWEVVDGSKVLKAKGGGGEAGSVQWGNISGKPTWIESNKPSYNWSEIQGEKPFYTKEEVAAKFVTIDTEQDITALKHFKKGLSIGEAKKLIYEEDGILFIDANVAVTGALTMYATGPQSVGSIYDGLPIDNDTIYWQEVDGSRVLKAREGSGSSLDKSDMWTALAGSTTEQINKSHLTTALTGYATESWVSEKNYAVKATTLAGYGITDAYTKTESDDRYLNVSGGDTIQGLITINHTTLDNSINIVREGSNNPTICFSNKTNGQLGRIGFNNEGKVCVYFKTSSDESYVWHSTNDGAGSGLDADLLDGTHKSGLLTALTSSSGTNISITVGGTTKSIADLYANSAYKLENTHTIWGQNFNGTQNITGRFTSNERVYADKGIWVTNNDIAGWGQSNAAFNLSIPNTSNTSGIICVYRSGQGNTGYTRFFSMEISNSSDSVRTYYANEVRIDITPTYMDINKQLNINGNTIIGSGGNLGIGTPNPAAKLHVIGDILATGGGTYYGSDIRYKLIMQQVNLSLLDIAKAPSFVYRWNKHGMNQNRLNLGGSAQYTQSVLPWAVEDNDNFLSMDYATVAYTFAVHTARHLLTYESRTDKKIKKLENRVKYLEKQLKKLGYEEVRTLDDSGI